MSDGVPSSLGRDPDDDLLLCAFVVCEVDQLPLEVLAVASGEHDETLRARLRQLIERGFLAEAGPAAADGAGSVLSVEQSPVDIPLEQKKSLASRLGRHLGAVAHETAAAADHAADVARLRSLCWSVVGLLRWELGNGLGEDAVRLARAWWPVAGLVGDSTWVNDFAEAGERAAIEIRDPSALIDLLRIAAECADQAGDWLMAEARWVRALSLARARKNHDVVCSTLTTLGDFYRRWGRLHRAMDVLSDLIATCDRVHDNRGASRALRDLALVLIDAGRAAAAVPHLIRAVALAGEDDAVEAGARAELLIMLGRAQWMSEKIRAAREAFSGALALLVDVDAEGADYVRSLLATPDDGSLPLKTFDAVEHYGRRTRPP
ncbi:tetratricopeptide repeat protein [Amycolatopsis sp. NPDC054798]